MERFCILSTQPNSDTASPPRMLGLRRNTMVHPGHRSFPPQHTFDLSIHLVSAQTPYSRACHLKIQQDHKSASLLRPEQQIPSDT